MKLRSDTTSAQNEFNLLLDNPLSTEERLKFGHQQIANTLKKIITRTVPPFTIGLYGSWGSGKTTIINLLKNNIDKRSIKTVYFDAWKYEADSLRRAFLLETTMQLLGKSSYEALKTNLYSTIQSTKEGDLQVRVKKLLILGILATPLFIVTLALSYLIFHDWSHWGQMLTAALAFSLVGGSLIQTLFSDLITKIIVVDELVLVKDRLTQPEEFEREFKLILGKYKTTKLLFIVDNLDRTTHDKAVTMLGTIKTFLEEEGCIFLIPCDEEAIKKQISSLYLQNVDTDLLDASSYSEEYLRKFFNLILRIPTFDEIELDTYTQSQLVETGLEVLQNNAHLDWIITYAFRSNPREIKQFINSLIAQVLLIKERIKSRHIQDKDVIKNNIAFIAKMLIIQVKYPKAYKMIEYSVLKEGIDWQRLKRYRIDGVLTKDSNFLSFFDETSVIEPEGVDIDFFLTLNQSAEENLLPNWSLFLKAAVSRDFESASKILDEIEKNKNIAELDEVGSNYVKQNKQNTARIQPMAATYFYLYQHNQKLPVMKRFGMEIGISLKDIIQNSYSEFKIGSVLPLLKLCLSNGQYENAKGVYMQFISGNPKDTQFTGKESAMDVYKFIAYNLDEFIKQSETIANSLKGNFLISEYLDIVFSTEKGKTFLYDKGIIEEYINRFSTSQPQAYFSDIDLNFMEKIDNLSKDQFEKLLSGIKNNIEYMSPQPYTPERKWLLSYILKLLENNKEFIITDKTISIKNSLQTLSTNLTNFYGQEENQETRLVIFRIALILCEIPDNDLSTSLEGSIINHFLTAYSYEESYEKLDKDDLRIIVSKYSSILSQPAVRDVRIYKKLSFMLPDNLKETIALSLISSDHNRAIDIIIKDLKYKISDTYTITNNLLSKFDLLDPQRRLLFFGIADKLNYGGNVDLAKVIYERLESENSSLPQNTYKKLLSKLKKFIGI